MDDTNKAEKFVVTQDIQIKMPFGLKNAPATFDCLMELNVGYQMLVPTMEQHFPDLQAKFSKLYKDYK